MVIRKAIFVGMMMFLQVEATIMYDLAIRNVIIAPDGVVSNVYPLEGNEKVIGLDYFSDKEGNIEAMLAKETGQLVLGEPFNLVQGGQALVGRLPVYVGKKTFLGFSISYIKLSLGIGWGGISTTEESRICL